MEQELQALQEIVDQAKRIVFFGGAGVSTESGISDFRSSNGLFHQPYAVSPETVLSRAFFDAHTKDFFDFYREKMITLWARPNKAHLVLAEMERCGKLSAVITQNIDGLHQAAGSKNVYELHGSSLRNHCMSCGRAHDVTAIKESTGVPRCACGGVIKPDVILYGEPLDEAVVDGAIAEIEQADTLLIAGTSLRVYPAAGLTHWFHGNKLVVINYDATDLDTAAQLNIRYPVGEILGALKLPKSTESI